MRKNWQNKLGLSLLVLFLTYAYIYPGGSALLSGRTDTVMSDDTDTSTLPYGYTQLVEGFKEHPSWFLYGAVYGRGPNPEHGSPQWIPWFERWSVVFLSAFFPIEQISTGFVCLLLILNFFAMYGLGRYLKWEKSTSLALGIAWAFSGYTRARAKVHPSLAGIFHIPLIFLGLYLLARGNGKKSLALAIIAFLVAVSGAHYYVVTSAFLAPAFLLFYFLQPEVRANLKAKSIRLGVGIAPAIAFLAFNLLVPIPPEVKLDAAAVIPHGGDTPDGKPHPFLKMFSARPLDYFSGDVAIGPADLNPLREALNISVWKNLDNSNPHERTNGIRWIFWFLALSAVYWMFKNKFPEGTTGFTELKFFGILGLFCFWLSLSPDIPSENTGASFWLYSLIKQVRVPSRAGIWVQFCVLMMSGIFLQQLRHYPKKFAQKIPKLYRWVMLPAVLPIVAVLELPPFYQSMPMSPVRPAFSELQGRDCGTGMYFPYVGVNWQLGPLYHFVQRMRGTKCGLLNTVEEPARVEWLVRRFPYHPKFFEAINANNPAVADSLERLVKCVPLTWLVFDENVPTAWGDSFCARLGWKMNKDRSCVAPNLATPLQKWPEQCGF